MKQAISWDSAERIFKVALASKNAEVFLRCLVKLNLTPVFCSSAFDKEKTENFEPWKGGVDIYSHFRSEHNNYVSDWHANARIRINENHLMAKAIYEYLPPGSVRVIRDEELGNDVVLSHSLIIDGFSKSSNINFHVALR